MLSSYSWSQFGLFILALVLLYYLVVGWLFYRPELMAWLASRRKSSSRSGGADTAGRTVPPPLVRPTSAFGPTPPEAEPAPVEDNSSPDSPAAEPVVGGQLPDSTAATGQQEGTHEAPTSEATAFAQPEAQRQDEARREELDRADEELAAWVRDQAPLASAEEELPPLAAVPALAPRPTEPLVDNYEPLASFEEPVASLLDIITPRSTAQLIDAGSVSEYIARLQAGQDPPMPAGLQGSCLAEQMAQHLTHYQAELAALFDDGE